MDRYFVCRDGSNIAFTGYWIRCEFGGLNAWQELNPDTLPVVEVPVPSQQSVESLSLTEEEYDVLYPWVIMMFVVSFAVRAVASVLTKRGH